MTLEEGVLRFRNWSTQMLPMSAMQLAVVRFDRLELFLQQKLLVGWTTMVQRQKRNYIYGLNSWFWFVFLHKNGFFCLLRIVIIPTCPLYEHPGKSIFMKTEVGLYRFGIFFSYFCSKHSTLCQLGGCNANTKHMFGA